MDLKLMARVLRYSRREFLLHLHSRNVQAGLRVEERRKGREEEEVGSHKEMSEEMGKGET